MTFFSLIFQDYFLSQHKKILKFHLNIRHEHLIKSRVMPTFFSLKSTVIWTAISWEWKKNLAFLFIWILNSSSDKMICFMSYNKWYHHHLKPLIAFCLINNSMCVVSSYMNKLKEIMRKNTHTHFSKRLHFISMASFSTR